MSIFPKRTRPGSVVTIHWNFNTAHLFDEAVCPLVRIGVSDPLGRTTMLVEEHILALPAVYRPEGQVHLNKNLPLLVTADYLSGKQSKERLVDILQNIQTGRHYYFHYDVPSDAPLGKYSLLSEVISAGEVRYSKTAADDHFFIEELESGYLGYEDGVHVSSIYNPSAEPLPVKVMDHEPGQRLTAERISAFELAPGEEKQLRLQSAYAYVAYCEERELIPLRPPGQLVVHRDPYWLRLDKAATGQLFLFHREQEQAYTLTSAQQEIWLAANGLLLASEVRQIAADAYDELLQMNIIREY